MNRRRRLLLPIIIAALATLPGLYLRLSGYMHRILPERVPGEELNPALISPQVTMVAIIAGIAILGASFLLLWACDAVQMDISQTLALAVVALIAVLPEYAVDMYFTWQAGQEYPAVGDNAHFAIANMTGANRLLIGVAWVVIVVIFWIRTRRPVVLEKERRTELFFLGLATLYAFFITIKGSLAWYDAIVFLGLYAWYIAIAGRRPCAECEAEGPAELLISLPKVKRRLATLTMFVFAAGVILANAEPFSEGLVASGTKAGIEEFLLVQWLAPIASEAPEFIVAIMFALRGQAGLALGSLLSSKLNQWTLLVGMIPLVFGISSGQLTHPIPMNSTQMHEILLTAAQSLMAVIMLAPLSLSIGQAAVLFFLFIGQFVSPAVTMLFDKLDPKAWSGDRLHQIFSGVYIAISLGIFLRRPRNVSCLWEGLKFEPVCTAEDETEEAEQEKESVSV
ncbi:MAG: sodium:calcium antiporter [Armatimonadota bacterium]